MEISSIQNLNNKNTNASFKAGVTKIYSDFDGTFMPYEYRHDVFCNNSQDSPRHEFLKNGKESFQNYFNSFADFLNKLKGKDDKKLLFTITTGRNLPEYNYFIKRIKEDGLKIPLPDQLITRNGGDIYTKRTDTEDFFTSNKKKAFLKSNVVTSKRKEIKKITNGWDGNLIKKTIKNFFQTKTNDCTVFEADTDGVFYADGMHFDSKRKKLNPIPENYVALKDNGNLEFHLLFPYANSDKTILTETQNALSQRIDKNGIKFITNAYSPKNENGYGEIIISPAIDGKKLNKVFDTKKAVNDIINKNSNDLVIVAGNDPNDMRMLNLFEYIDLENNEDITCEKNLEKIYKLPLIAIYIDNSIYQTNENTEKTKKTIEELKKHFNSDGNTRFIHVIPNNTEGKPQNLLEGIQLAINEYAKRNPEFAKNLSTEIQEFIKTNN